MKKNKCTKFNEDANASGIYIHIVIVIIQLTEYAIWYIHRHNLFRKYVIRIDN